MLIGEWRFGHLGYAKVWAISESAHSLISESEK
jgi:hypothetical protein